MRIVVPDIPEAERTPLVQKLLAIIALQQDYIQQLEERLRQLEDEIARLKGLKPRPPIAPSSLEPPPRPPRDPEAKRPGSAQRYRPKTAELALTEETVLRLPHFPEMPSSRDTRTSSFRISSSRRASSSTAANAGRSPMAATWWPPFRPISPPAATTERT